MLIVNKTFLLLTLTVLIVVIVLANIELLYNSRKCNIKLPLNKDFHILEPSQTGLKHNIVIYKNNCKEKEELKQTYGGELSIKKSVDEHVGSKLVTPIMDLTGKLKNIPHSSTPINDVIGCIGKSSTILNDSDPRNFDGSTSYRMLNHPEDNTVKAFIAYRMLYVVSA